jgi:antitoxin CptB
VSGVVDRPDTADRTEPAWLHAMISRVELNRLRWRCRRGMLENDLILARFLDVRGERISATELVALDRLLQLSDNELWDLLSSRQEVADATVAPLLEALRAVGACEDASPPGASVSDSAWE